MNTLQADIIFFTYLAAYLGHIMTHRIRAEYHCVYVLYALAEVRSFGIVGLALDTVLFPDTPVILL